jgi:hypothetical protein
MREIEPEKILETATAIVASARRSIQMTMEAREELASPLPQAYFQLLKQKLEEDVRVERIGFGKDQDFARLGDQVIFTHPNYSFTRTEAKDYHRMLLVDSSRLLFARVNESGRHVYFTEDPGVTADFRQYFDSHASE